MKGYKKWITVGVIAFLVAAAVLSGYAMRRRKAVTPYSLIYIPKTEGGTNDFWTSLISGAEMAAQTYGGELQVWAPSAEEDVKRQRELLIQAIKVKPDALLISPSSFSEFNALLEQAKEEGILLVYVDSYTEEDIQDLLVSTDNMEAGKKLGEFSQTFLHEDSRIAVVSHVQGVSTAVERESGFRQGLGDYEKNIVDVCYCNSSFDKSYELTMELISKYPDLEMIAGMNEYSSVGAARAVWDAGLSDKIKVVGIDSSQEIVELMEKGVFRGIVVQKAFKMGYVGVKETLRMLNGEKVEKKIDSGCELVTPDNMYSSEIEKLIFPFDFVKE